MSHDFYFTGLVLLVATGVVWALLLPEPEDVPDSTPSHDTTKTRRLL